LAESKDKPKSANAGTSRSRWIGLLLKYVVPAVISVGLCWLLFTGIDFGEMIDIIRSECDFTFIAIALALSVVSHVFRAMRWGLQLRALDVPTPFFPLLLSIFGTYAVNLVFPRLGEVWRTGYIAQRQRAPFATVFGSMVADRLADVLTVVLITLATFIIAAGPLTSYLAGNRESYDKMVGLLSSPWIWGSLAVIVLLFVWLFTSSTANGVVIRIRETVRGLWQGFATVFTMPHRGLWLMLTVCLWGCYFVQMWIAFYAFPFTASVVAQHGVTAVLVTFVMSSIMTGVPSNGGIGPWQWAVIFALGIYGMGRTESGAFANVVLGSQTLLLIALGIFTFAAIALEKRKARKGNNRQNIIRE